MSMDQQVEVNAYFQLQATYWKDIYKNGDVYARIHQQRHERVLKWVEELGLDTNARILEIGCGAGFLSLDLARRGFTITSIDSAEAMVEQTREHAKEVGLDARISVTVGDISALAFPDNSFDLVLAIGVFPWIPSINPASREIARVLKPGGHALLTADNRARLNIWFDPCLNPFLAAPKRLAKNVLNRSGLRHRSANDVGSHFHAIRFVDKTLASFGLNKVQSSTLGFGPFTLFYCRLLSDASGIRLHNRLQGLAERGAPLFRSTGAQYIVLTQKSHA